MKRLLILLPLFLFLSQSTVASAQIQRYPEYIESFDTSISVVQKGVLQIQESIVYTTSMEKHGIYRYIPYRYKRGGQTKTVKISNEAVRDEKGKEIPFTVSNDDGNKVLKIGDKDVTFSGTQVYRISYEVHNALEGTDESPKLVWDITGEGWSFPILHSSARVSSPFAAIATANCYSGIVGGDDKKCQVITGTENVGFSYRERIERGLNMTVEVTFKPGHSLALPSKQERQVKEFIDNLWLVALPLPLLILFAIWWKHGRDYMFVGGNVFDHSDRPTMLRPLFFRDPAPMVYEPLDISPGQAGAILDERYDNQDLVADILDLARKKYIELKQIQEKGFLKAADYSFTKLAEPDSKLPPHQKRILQGLFASGKSVKLSQLKGTFYTELEKIKKDLFDSLTAQKMFVRNPNTARALFASVGIVLYVVLIFLLGPLIGIFSLHPWAFVVVLLEIGIGIVLLVSMNQKTAKGFNYMQQARGLQETIKRGKWREEIKEKHLFIEEILPFAVSLGVIHQLSKHMKDLGLEPPSYIHGSSVHAWSATSFVNSFSSDVGSNLSYNPSSSSWSGGGSSGGGGGGGGGGSW